MPTREDQPQASILTTDDFEAVRGAHEKGT